MSSTIRDAVARASEVLQFGAGAEVAGFRPVSLTGRVFVDGTCVCSRCGRDETGDRWPDCAEIKTRTRGVIDWDGQTLHAATCGRFWPGEGMWVCDSCEAALNDERTPPSAIAEL